MSWKVAQLGSPALWRRWESHVLISKRAHLCRGLGIFWKLRAWPRTAGSCRPASRPRGPLLSLRPYKGSASRRPGSDAPRATSEAGGEGRPRDKKTSDAGGGEEEGQRGKEEGRAGLTPDGAVTSEPRPYAMCRNVGATGG